MKSLFCVVFILLCGTTWARGKQEEPGLPQERRTVEAVELDGRPLRVMAGTSIVADVVGEIAGDYAVVTSLIPAGRNPHSHEFTPADIAGIEEADLIFVNGLNLEESLVPILRNVRNVISVSEEIIPLTGHDDHGGHDEHEGDPHFWFDPANVMSWTAVIARVLGDADPDNHEDYERAAATYIAELESLDKEIRKATAAVPMENRKLVVDHEVLGYFAEAYDFEVVGSLTPSFSDQTEVFARFITDLADVMRDKEIRVVFVGAEAAHAVYDLISILSDELGRELDVVELLTESLAPSGQRGDHYLDSMRYNSERITSALMY